jgi:acyl-CoA reductase-like NAD-dependent aldehyde dehydrogenase
VASRASAGTGLPVQSGIYDDLLTHIVGNVAKLRLSDRADESTAMGPVCSRSQLVRIERFAAIGEIAEGSGW